MQYGLSEAFVPWPSATASGKYEAVVTLNAALTHGAYALTLRDNVVDDYGNKLDGNGDGTAGGDYVLNFNVTPSIPVVTDVQGISDTNVVFDIPDSAILDHNAAELVVTFNEPLDPTTVLDYVMEPDPVSGTLVKTYVNWSLIRGGSDFYSKIINVQYGLSEAHQLDSSIPASGKYEAVVTLDGNPFMTRQPSPVGWRL